MSMRVYSLILEVTRRCNMCCEHCLRGDAENIDMQKETIDKILDLVDEIQSVVFSGGEPSLNLPLIQYFFDRAEQKGKFPGYFWLATNGKENQEELAMLALKAWIKSYEKELCGVALSVDAFHEPVLVNLLSGLSFYDDCKEQKVSGTDIDKFVIRTGRAEENGLGRIPANMDNRIYIENGAIETLYVSAKGQCVFNCNLPYFDIDENGVSLEEVLAEVKSMTEGP